MSTFAQFTVEVERIKHLAAVENDHKQAAYKAQQERHRKIAEVFPAGRCFTMSNGRKLIVSATRGDSVFACIAGSTCATEFDYYNIIK